MVTGQCALFLGHITAVISSFSLVNSLMKFLFGASTGLGAEPWSQTLLLLFPTTPPELVLGTKKGWPRPVAANTWLPWAPLGLLTATGNEKVKPKANRERWCEMLPAVCTPRGINKGLTPVIQSWHSTLTIQKQEAIYWRQMMEKTMVNTPNRKCLYLLSPKSTLGLITPHCSTCPRTGKSYMLTILPHEWLVSD